MNCVDLKNQRYKDSRKRCFNNKNWKIKDCNKNNYYTNSNKFKTKMIIKISNMNNIMKKRINMLIRSLKIQKILLIKILIQALIFQTELSKINLNNYKTKSNMTKIISITKIKIHFFKMKSNNLLNRTYSTLTQILINMNNMLRSSSRKNSIHISSDNQKMIRCII